MACYRNKTQTSRPFQQIIVTEKLQESSGTLILLVLLLVELIKPQNSKKLEKFCPTAVLLKTVLVRTTALSKKTSHKYCRIELYMISSAKYVCF